MQATPPATAASSSSKSSPRTHRIHEKLCIEYITYIPDLSGLHIIVRVLSTAYSLLHETVEHPYCILTPRKLLIYIGSDQKKAPRMAQTIYVSDGEIDEDDNLFRLFVASIK